MTKIKSVHPNVIAVVTVFFGAVSMLGVLVLGNTAYQLIFQGAWIALFAVFVVFTLRRNRLESKD